MQRNLRLSLLGIVLLIGVTTTPVRALPACDVTLVPGQNIQTALGSGGSSIDPWVVCLTSGTWNLSTRLQMPNYSELRGVYNAGWFSKIQSTADRNIVVENKTGVVLRHLIVDGSTTASEYNILAYQSSNVQILQNLIRYSKTINVGLNGGSNYTVADNTIAYQGYGSSAAEPSIWNNATSYVTITRNTIYGRANGPGGDGEIASYDCSNLTLTWNYHQNSGASTFYIVNCSGGTIANNSITNSGEWGLDLVQGTSNFVIEDNRVNGSYFGSVVVSDVGTGRTQTNLTFVDNTFRDGNSGGVANCPCMNINYSSSSITQTGTTCTVNNVPQTPTCSWP